jgi:hypothetical protein
MRKVELLPGGTLASHSPDFIGQSPQDLWAAQADHDVLVAVKLYYTSNIQQR